MANSTSSKIRFDFVNFNASLKSKMSSRERKRFREVVRRPETLSFAKGILQFHSVTPYVVGFVEDDWYTSLDGDGEVEIEYSDIVDQRALGTIEMGFSSYLNTITRLMRRRMQFEVQVQFHLKTKDTRLKQFIRLSVALARGSHLQEALSKEATVRGLYVHIDKQSELTLSAPNHIDVNFTLQISSERVKKGYLQTYFTKAVSMLERLG